jgi:tight adherence protein C
MMLLFIAVICFATAAYYIGELVTAPQRERQNLVTRATQYGRMRVIHGRELPRFRDRAIAPLVGKLARIMLRVNPRTTIEGVSARLMAAGMRTTSPSAYLAAKAILAVVGLFIGIAFASSVGGMKGLLVLVLASAIGFYAPTYVVTVRARRRQESVSADLPDALDLLAVSVEAGLGFDGAIAKLTEHMDGPLIEEFELALGEIRVGEGRADALKKMAERVPAQEMASFVRAIVQADQLGISLGRLLRVQATDARLKRQAAAEEKAMKAPIKMLFPMVVFIFPAMFIVILGPALLNLGQLFTL